MSEILSQDEVNSLLEGLSSGKVESETDVAPEPDEIPPFDFAGQERAIRGRMPTFEVINERFARKIRASLSSLLHTDVGISSEGLNTLKFSEFVRSLPVPTSLHVFRMEPFRGHAMIVLESRLVFNLVDTFCGGKGTGAARVEGREFTSIENTMIQKVISVCIEDLETSWAPVEAIKTVFVRSEINPRFATIVPPADLVIVVKFRIELEQAAGTLIVCIPYAMIEPLRSKLSASFQAEAVDVDTTWQKRLKEVILDSTVDVAVQLGTVEITGERLIQMKTGDIIQLDQNAGDSLTAFIGGQQKIKGYAGIQRGFQAFRIEEKLTLE